MQGHIRYYKH